MRAMGANLISSARFFPLNVLFYPYFGPFGLVFSKVGSGLPSMLGRDVLIMSHFDQRTINVALIVFLPEPSTPASRT